MALEGVTEGLSRSSGRDTRTSTTGTLGEDVDETGNARRGRVIQPGGIRSPSMGAVVGAVESGHGEDERRRYGRKNERLGWRTTSITTRRRTFLPPLLRKCLTDRTHPDRDPAGGELRQGSHVLRGIRDEGPGIDEAEDIFIVWDVPRRVQVHRRPRRREGRRDSGGFPRTNPRRGSARIVVCSDGVWDVRLAEGDEDDSVEPRRGRRRLCTVAREKRSSAASRWTTSRQSSSTSKSTRRAPATPRVLLRRAVGRRARVNINRKVLFDTHLVSSPSSRFARV